MKVTKSPTDAAARTNCVFVNPRDLPDPNTRYVSFDDVFVFTVRTDPSIPLGEVGTTLFHRRLASLSINQEVRFAPYYFSDPTSSYIGTLHLQISFLRKGFETAESFDTSEMQKLFISLFGEQAFAERQSLCFDYHGHDLLVMVTRVEVFDLSSNTRIAPRGILTDQSSIVFEKAPDSSMKLKGTKDAAANSIIKPNFNFEDLGIGGLDDEFSNIFRRAFVSRIFPPSIVEKMGIQHVKGILLYGPPGTGKTLMARQIGKMLNAKEPQIVNGPEILNKYVGQSEENIRKLFAAAEQEYKQRGEESSLHIIIFDELDAICKQRGSKNDGTGVGDSIVNQLLSKMDGVDQLNNILIIGMTNRLDMIDEALLRPGRLEIHMEINLPDEKGRVQIFKVHTNKMRQANLLDVDVDLNELASLTKNFSGAEISGLVKSASSFAFNRHVKIQGGATIEPNYDQMKLSRQDFMMALDEVHPAFGVSEGELKQCVLNGIIKFSPHIEQLLMDGQLFTEQVKNSTRTPLVSLLLHGPSGSGKTALAATIAMSSDFPFIKLISPESMVGFSEQAKMNHISKIFSDAYKSPLSVIVVDEIERLLDWVAIGPRFSNMVLQTLLVLLKKPPTKNHKLLIIGTTSQKNVLEQMDITEAFNSSIYVPNISQLSGVDAVLRELKTFSLSELQKTSDILYGSGIDNRISISIKKLLYITEMASQDVDKMDKFISLLTREGTFTLK